MITKISGIGAFPGNKIFIKNSEERLIGSSVVTLNCTFEIDIFDIISNSLLYITEIDKNNNLINRICINFPSNEDL
ncbi:hypothetical protein BH747_09960 [Enterococcus villorum]|uniref:Uncharacterized protein n=1 Tax=Enterococcus villorum TaxID=112904 RepID=A0A1V8YAG8_9ENTE|nr:hypothetical protein [Enterococcus villorum]OQO69585.1 hypothetical protein BH747_09960 [Enterococcus villorum]OQO72663.1 hypothetical protein BH744_11140 [Enterococcus villorum]